MHSKDMDDVAGVIGVDLAMVLAARRGGRILHVPSSEQNDKFLHLIIGREAARSMISAMGGVGLKLPTLKELERHRRNELICRLSAQGLPRTDIAVAADVSERHVARILKEEEALVAVYARTGESVKADAP